MKIHRVLRRGSDHPDFCQDAIAEAETSNFIYCCVFDGCSGGKDSHFASALFVKAFNDVAHTLQAILNKEDSIEQNAKFLAYMISRKISEVKIILNLDIIELLSTMVLCVINKNTKECLIVAFGDGYFYVDGTEVIIKNTRFISKENGDNMPDYIAYDLDKIEAFGDFEQWFNSKSEIHKFENVQNVSIASDGICTFKNYKATDNKVNPIEYLVQDEAHMDTKNMLERKYNILRNTYNMMNTDDLSLIRIKF